MAERINSHLFYRERSFIFLNFIYVLLYFCFWLPWVLAAVGGLSLVAVRGHHPGVVGHGLLFSVASLVVDSGS